MITIVAGPPVELVLSRGLLPDLPLRPGTVVYGRVIDARTLLLAGLRIQAQLPDDVAPGQRLRLRVEQSSTERLALKILARIGSPSAAAASGGEPATIAAAQAQESGQPSAASVYPLMLPGGVSARLYIEEQSPSGKRSQTTGGSLMLRYDSPTLGRLDIRLDGSSATIEVSAGEPAEVVRAAAEQLRVALERVRGSTVYVSVHQRAATFDGRA